MTFEEWLRSTDIWDEWDEKEIASTAWHHQQKIIDKQQRYILQLEEELNDKIQTT